jgi:hypothetical protein
MTISIAFFLSQTGDLIHVPTSHIGTIISGPERFGLTREEIDAAYQKHGERIGVEGEARKELLLRIINQGWIRIRRYRQRWSITAPSLSPVVHQRLRDWATQMLCGIDGFKEQDRHMPVRISSSEGEFHCTIGEIADDFCPW